MLKYEAELLAGGDILVDPDGKLYTMVPWSVDGLIPELQRYASGEIDEIDLKIKCGSPYEDGDVVVRLHLERTSDADHEVQEGVYAAIGRYLDGKAHRRTVIDRGKKTFRSGMKSRVFNNKEDQDVC